MTAPDRVLIEILIAAPIEVVWQALRDPAEIRRWFGWDYAQLVEEIDMIFGPGAVPSDDRRTLSFPNHRTSSLSRGALRRAPLPPRSLA